MDDAGRVVDETSSSSSMCVCLCVCDDAGRVADETVELVCVCVCACAMTQVVLWMRLVCVLVISKTCELVNLSCA